MRKVIEGEPKKKEIKKLGCPECFHHKVLHDKKGCVMGCKCKLVYDD